MGSWAAFKCRWICIGVLHERLGGIELSRKPWTEEEVDYLESNWGSLSINGIAKHLNRSFHSVKMKARRLGLSDPLLHFDGITLHQLSSVLNISDTVLRHWVKQYDFPAKQKLFVKERRVLVVKYKDFWDWAKRNKQMIDFSRLEPNILGPEPSWVKEKRKADQIKNIHLSKTKRTPWSKDEDAWLKWMLKKFKYTYPEIAAELKRSQGAIKRRIKDLGLKERPVRLPNHFRYTEEEVKLLIDLYEKGYSFEVIGKMLNKSALGVRGKLERMGYKFRNGVPIKMAAPEDEFYEMSSM
jgi:hypothetical protein